MKNQLFSYSNFLGQFKQVAKAEIDETYTGHANAAYRNLLVFLKKHSGTISRWRLALLTRLIRAEELARLIRKLLTEFPTDQFNGADRKAIELTDYKRHMLRLLAKSLEANADAVANAAPPGTLRLRMS